MHSTQRTSSIAKLWAGADLDIKRDRVGEATENPFEGGANDVPITALARDIEIDLLEMIDEKELPDVLPPKNNILM